MKNILVTGGAKGIGREIAIQLAQKGYSVLITYNTSYNEAVAIKKQYENIDIFPCDISKYSDVTALFEYINKKYKAIDGLVNNAGVSYYGILQEMPQQNIDQVIATNLIGTIYVTQQAAAIMVAQHSGAIVNIASIWGVRGASCEAVYSAAKGGVITFTRAMAQELAPSGIMVNCISPGVIKTDMLADFSQKEIEILKNETPVGRIGSPLDVARAVLFLLDEENSFITGENITVDGGFCL